jgi:hypothetical protein
MTASRPGPAHDVLVHRLSDRHGLRLLESHFAVRRVALGIPGRHEELVRAEAHLLLREIVATLQRVVTELARALMSALQQLGEAARRASAAMEQAAANNQAARRDRPAWATPYGPPPRRHTWA